ncbi:Gll0496 protein [hydrothermal vent metagenome]|uniref:Gll0496 protein n=1 Tax=hydrothermal vent metagenome TaxID=652676 RepID=A0A3B0ZWJ4_9ZZZZ
MQTFPQYNKGSILATLSFTLLAAFSAPAIANDSTDAKLQQAIAGDHRSEKNSVRDQYRKPLETLSWLGIKDDMTVVEITPGGGWYSEILAPYLKENGTYYAAGFDAESERRYFRKAAKAFKEKLAANPVVYGNVKVTELAPPSKTNIAPAGSADMVLTFRNVHNWMSAGNTDVMLAAMYTALKPGGILGVVEHRGNPEVKQNLKADTGYVNEDYTIAMVEKAGFKLVGKSELLANSKDNRKHSQGVWTLPPRLKLGIVDKEKYLAIGESDRMLLKFTK